MVRDLGNKLKLARMRAGFTQQEAAERLGLSKGSTISSYEAAGSNPNAETLMKLAALYNVSTDYLLGLEREKALFVDGLNNDEIDNLHDTADLFRKNKEK